jgi:hypothetical protein
VPEQKSLNVTGAFQNAKYCSTWNIPSEPLELHGGAFHNSNVLCFAVQSGTMPSRSSAMACQEHNVGALFKDLQLRCYLALCVKQHEHSLATRWPSLVYCLHSRCLHCARTTPGKKTTTATANATAAERKWSAFTRHAAYDYIFWHCMTRIP